MTLLSKQLNAWTAGCRPMRAVNVFQGRLRSRSRMQRPLRQQQSDCSQIIQTNIAIAERKSMLNWLLMAGFRFVRDIKEVDWDGWLCRRWTAVRWMLDWMLCEVSVINGSGAEVLAARTDQSSMKPGFTKSAHYPLHPPIKCRWFIRCTRHNQPSQMDSFERCIRRLIRVQMPTNLIII